jgi:hypothetical protein
VTLPRRNSALRGWPLLLGLVLAISLLGCRPLGPGTPHCGELEVVRGGSEPDILIARPTGEATSLNAAELLQLQAVPSADWGVCVEDLPAGWNTGMLTAERGRAELSLAATSLGLPFVRVTVSDRCEVPEDAQPIATSGDGPQRFVQVHDVTTGIEVAIVPVAARHHDAARTVTSTLTDREVRGTPLQVALAAGSDDVATRIDRALGTGSNVLVVDDDYLRRGEVELRSPQGSRAFVAPVGRILTELGERAQPQVYRATWWHPSPRSCIVYDIAARGPGALEVPEHLDGALGFLPLAELRGHLEESGYDVAATS